MTFLSSSPSNHHFKKQFQDDFRLSLESRDKFLKSGLIRDKKFNFSGRAQPPQGLADVSNRRKAEAERVPGSVSSPGRSQTQIFL